MSSIKQIGSFASFVWDKNIRDKLTALPESKKDSLEISNTARVYDKLDKFMNLGAGGRLELSELNSEEKKEFLKMLAELIKNGVIGYEVLEVNGKPEKHYLENQIGNERLKGAKLFIKKDLYQIKR
ncbi:MAG: hypothetical protein AB1394_05960 [Bacteroidota bacterium]